jgi:copper(I)-binding protein
MRGAWRKRGLRAAGALLATCAAACGGETKPAAVLGEAFAAAGGIAIYAPRIPEPAADVAALYLVVSDQDGRGDRLIAARSEAGHAMLHETREEGGLVRMRQATDGLAVPRNGELRLEPGGAHVMLTGLRQPLAAGGRVYVTLEFERAGRLRLEVPVVATDAGSDVALGPPE